MALKNIQTGDMGMKDGVHGISGRPYFYLHEEKNLVSTISLFSSVKPDKTNFTGYSKTKELLENSFFQEHQNDWSYPALQVFTTWNNKKNEVRNASKWYIPSVAQLYAAAGGCYGVESKSGYPAVKK